MIDPNKPWLMILTNEQSEHEFEVLGYMCFKDEETALETTRRRGEICDWFGLYLNEPIPDTFHLEVISLEDYTNEYKVPLKNYVEYYN